MEEIDIWRSANQLIKSYGEKAAEVAAGKVVEMQRADDGEGMTASSLKMTQANRLLG
jgi:hypothetical protein